MFSRIRPVIYGVLIIALILGAAGCNLVTSNTEEEPTPTPIPPPPVPEKPTYTVQRGEVLDAITFSGRLSPVVEEELFFRAAGRVVGVHVERNDMVEKGQILAELDTEDLVRQRTQASLELEAANANLQNALADKDYRVEKARLNLEIKQLQLAKMEEQDSDVELRVAEANMQKADAARKAAQRAYDVRAQQSGAEASPQALSLEQATINYQLSQVSYDQAVANSALRDYDLEVQRRQVALAQLDFDYIDQTVDPNLLSAVERNQLSIERLDAQIADRVVTSPIDGKVTAVSTYEGRTVNGYETVVVVADESQLEITCDPQTEDLMRLEENMEVTLSFSAYPGEEFVGVITQLPYPYGGGGATEGTDDTDKLTHLAVDTTNLTVRPGDLVRISVVLERKADALWLQPAAIRTFAGRQFVVVEEDGRQRRVDVRIGIESTERIEILEGLEEGQIVVGQ